MNKVAVVILNWNGKDFLEKFLPSVVQFSEPFAKVVLADNASSDDSVEFVSNQFPSVEIILNQTNDGYTGGYNAALKKIEAKYYVLLNSDIEVTANWIEPVIELMDSDSKIAACQPKILAYDDKTLFEYAGAAGGFLDKYGYPFCRGRIFQILEEDKGAYNDSIEVFWASGACMFVRSELFHQLDGFDNDFFAHMEEIDFCWRLKNLGYKIMYCGASTIYHVGGGTLPKTSSRKTYFNFRNNLFLLYKNLPSNRLLKTFAARLFLDGIAGLKFAAEGYFKDTWAVVRAHLSFYKNFRKTCLKRKDLNQHMVGEMYWSNIAYDHFIKRRKYFGQLIMTKFTKTK